MKTKCWVILEVPQLHTLQLVLFFMCVSKTWNAQLKSYHHNQGNTWAKSFVRSERREQRRWNYSTLRETKMQNFSSHKNQHHFISAQCSKSKQEVTGTKLKLTLTLTYAGECWSTTQLLTVKGFCAQVRTSEPPHIKDRGINKRAPFSIRIKWPEDTELLAGLHPVPRSLNPHFSTLTIFWQCSLLG